jgi:hypothetical protein
MGIGGLFVLAILATIFSGNDTNKGLAKTEQAVTETSTEPKKSDPQNWAYSEDVDKMTSEKKYFGICNSTNEVEFEFPYQGGSNLSITIRNQNNKNEVLVSISKGQIMTSILGEKYFRAKFDDNKPVYFAYNSASDGSADVVFVENVTKFISLLKSSKKLIIELEFFNAGNKLFDFSVEGLKWDK